MPKELFVSLLLSFLPALLIISLSPLKFDKYLYAFQKELPRTSELIYWYENIDTDNKYEHFRIYNHKNSGLAISICNSKQKIIEQLNLNYFMPKSIGFIKPFFIDFNKDNVKELLVFTQNKDSIYLNIADLNKDEFILKDRFITKIGLSNKSKLDFDIRWVDTIDVNNDGIKEIYFMINTGFGLFPRNIYRYDFVNDSLVSSPNAGAKINNTIFLNKEILFVYTKASNNCKKDFPYPYPDTCSWIFGFNKNLKYAFEPIPFAGVPSSFTSMVKTGDGVVAVFNNNESKGDTTQLVHINSKGELTKRKHFFDSRIYTIDVKGAIKNIIHFKNTNKFHYINLKEGSIGKEIRQLKECSYISSKDIDNDGEIEHFFITENLQQLIIARNDLKSFLTVNLDISKENIVNVNSKFENNYGEIIIHTQANALFYNYYKNPKYLYKYVFWIIVYLLSFIFIYSILYLQRMNINKKIYLEKRIVQLQIKNTQNQLDPHFTFNVLNTISNYIFKEDKYKAYDLFERFATLIRTYSDFSDSIFRTLKKELRFTLDYLELQKYRFKDRFDYKTEIDENINTEKVQIPKMMIQSFVENVLKHAFIDLPYKGLITISIKLFNKSLIINIEDNGIGINASKKANPIPKSGKGMGIMEEQIALINKLYEQKIELKIIDKSVQNENKTGTIVQLKFYNPAYL